MVRQNNPAACTTTAARPEVEPGAPVRHTRSQVPLALLQNRLRALIAWSCWRLPLWACRLLAHVPKFHLPATSRLLRDEPSVFSSRPGPIMPPARAITLSGAPCALRSHVNIQHAGDTDFTGRRAAILAHWDPHGCVDPYVMHYLQHIRSQGYATVLSSDRALDLPAGLASHVDAVIWRDCPGYDFTSWKCALECFPSLYAAQELLITNDSIFAPVNPLAPVHRRMDAQACDFWGLAESQTLEPHLQSFYLVFRPGALTHPCFQYFWDRVDTSVNKENVIFKHELILSNWLQQHGLAGAAYIPQGNMTNTGKPSDVYHHWRQLIRHCGFPCVKRDILAGKHWWIDLDGWDEELAQADYPVQLVTDYFSRITNTVV